MPCSPLGGYAPQRYNKYYSIEQRQRGTLPYFLRDNPKLLERLNGRANLSKQYPTEKWEHSYIAPNGGYVVTEHQRIKEGKRNSAEREIFNKEMSMCKVLAEHGHEIQYLQGTNRPLNQTFDVLFDRIPTDLKSFSGAGAMVKQIKHALEEQGAKIVVVRLEKTQSNKTYEKLLEARRKVKGRIFFYREESPEILVELFN